MKYTKKQILEAIRYWENQLKLMNESKSPLLNAFIKEFGEDLVFDNSMKFELTRHSIQKIFEIIDKVVFNSKFTKKYFINLYCDTVENINQIVISQYGAGSDYDMSGMLALYQPKISLKFNSITNKRSLTFDKHGIFINLSEGKFVNLSYAIATICHEMIHAFDAFEGNLIQLTASMLMRGCTSDMISKQSHFTEMFQKKKLNMKKQHGITIIYSGDDKSFDVLNTDAADDIKELREFEENSEVTCPFDHNDRYVTLCDDGGFILRFS